MSRAPRREVRGPRFDGARALDAYLRETGQSVPAFCEKHHLDRFLVQRLLAGLVRRPPSVETVSKIRDATNRRVDWWMWSEGAYRSDESGVPPIVDEVSR